MARLAPPGPRLLRRARVLAPLLIAGCASWHATPVPPELTPDGVARRVLAPYGLNVNPAETVVQPGAPDEGPPDAPAPQDKPAEPTIFTLPDAIAFALRNSPRLRSARAAIERARGQEQAAFAPFLPQIDVLGQYGVISSTLAPGIPGNEGFLLASGTGTRDYAQTEVALEWTLYDFGRTGGRYRQAAARERIADLQLARAEQTVQFDVAAGYLDVLLARASRRVQEDAVRRAEAILEDTEARRKAGVLLKEDVLRAQVQLSESREALIAAREREFNAVARLNNTMGRNAAMPLEVVDLDLQPPFPGTLPGLLERAAAQRPEVGLAQQEVAAAQAGRQAARGDFLPRVFVRADAGHTDGQNVVTGWQEGAGLHLDAPLYSGGLHRGELHAAEANVEDAVANAQSILDAISLQVNLAYRGAVAAQETIELARTAVEQAEEDLRLVRVRYRNGNATPTDVVDAEAAVTRSQQRYFSAGYSYLAALARLDYTVGGLPGVSGAKCDATRPEQLPFPRKLPDEK